MPMVATTSVAPVTWVSIVVLPMVVSMEAMTPAILDPMEAPMPMLAAVTVLERFLWPMTLVQATQVEIF